MTSYRIKFGELYEIIYIAIISMAYDQIVSRISQAGRAKCDEKVSSLARRLNRIKRFCELVALPIFFEYRKIPCLYTVIERKDLFIPSFVRRSRKQAKF